MSDLSERLIARMREYRVRLSFDGNLLKFDSEMSELDIETCIKFHSVPGSDVDVSLARTEGKEYDEYLLIYNSNHNPDRWIWQKIAQVSIPVYHAVVLASAVFHLKRAPTTVRARLPLEFEQFVDKEHLKLLSSQGEYSYVEAGGTGPVPVYDSRNLESLPFWNELKVK